ADDTAVEGVVVFRPASESGSQQAVANRGTGVRVSGSLRGGSTRLVRQGSAEKFTTESGGVDFRAIGNDVDAAQAVIESCLEPGETLDDVRAAAVRRGRPPSDAVVSRRRLRSIVREARARDAKLVAIGSVLGCHKATVSKLLAG